jgi:uncharacterized protein YndB with AHSA1/START domain
MRASDGRVFDNGNVVEIDPPRRLVLSWQHQLRADLAAEGASRMTWLLEDMPGSTKLTVIHEIPRDGSKLIQAVSGGWPMILSSMKTLLETGDALPDPRAAG